MKNIKERIIPVLVVIGFIIYTTLLLIIVGSYYNKEYKSQLELKDNEIVNVTEALITASNNECYYYVEEVETGFIIDGAYYEYKNDMETYVE